MNTLKQVGNSEDIDMGKSRRNLPYQEGSWLAIPLRTGGYALGIITRIGAKGITFGYFFGPASSTMPTMSDAATKRVEEAIWMDQFGDLGILNGEWTVIGVDAAFERQKWPLPSFGRIDERAGLGWQVTYSDELECVNETPCDIAIASTLPRDGLSGYGAVEIKLTKLLADKPV